MRSIAMLSSLWLAGCSVFGISSVAEPPFRRLVTLGPIEIRQYAPRIVAETTVQAGELAARSTGFRRIAGYIFGGNHERATIAMTAPVVQARAGSAWTIRFFMPAAYTMQSLPTPEDTAVQLVALPAQTVAALRYSGSISPAAVARETVILLHALLATRWKPQGDPVAWFYDPPWTLPPLRRNEVAVAVTAGQPTPQ